MAWNRNKKGIGIGSWPDSPTVRQSGCARLHPASQPSLPPWASVCAREHWLIYQRTNNMYSKKWLQVRIHFELDQNHLLKWIGNKLVWIRFGPIHFWWRNECALNRIECALSMQCEWAFKGVSTLDTLQCTSEAGFWTSFKWSVLKCIDALWRVYIVYTIRFAHNLAAVHGEQYSVVVLYREGKMQSYKGFVKEWFDRQHTNTSSLYWEGFGKGWKRHALCRKRSGLFEKSS